MSSSIQYCSDWPKSPIKYRVTYCDHEYGIRQNGQIWVAVRLFGFLRGIVEPGSQGVTAEDAVKALTGVVMKQGDMKEIA
jgi:hypothetical protein